MSNHEDYSRHIFMFPFRLETKQKNDRQAPEIEYNIKELFTTVLKSGWQYKPFTIKQPADYNEYVYFHEYARQVLYQTKTELEINDLLDNNPDSYDVISYYFEKNYNNPDISFEIFDDSKKPSGIKVYQLKLTDLSLRIFATGIGVLTLHLANNQYSELDDILLINDFARRIYPPFLGSGNDCVSILEPPKRSLLCEKIKLLENGREKSCDDFSEYKLDYKEILTGIHLPNYINYILGDPFTDNFAIIPIIDDRMFTLCWFGSNRWSNWLKADYNNELVYKSSDEWLKFIFVDGKGINCVDEEMKRELIAESTYKRWSGYGTFYGISRYSFMILTDQNKDFSPIIQTHFETMYYQIAVLLLAQRAAILKFSHQASLISKDIELFMRQKENQKKNQIEFAAISTRVRRLHSSYIRFMNRLWFTEVTPQDQGIELYQMAQKAMNLEKQVKEIKNEIKELYEFIDMNYEKSKNLNLEQLNNIAFKLLPITIATGFWGMNLYFTNLFTDAAGAKDYFLIAASFVLFLTTTTGFYYYVQERMRKTKTKPERAFHFLAKSSTPAPPC